MDMRNNTQTNNMNNQIKDKSTLYIVYGAIQFMFCSMITGILTIVLAVLAKQDFDKNNIDAYTEKIKAAKIVTIVAIVLGIIAAVASIGVIVLTYIAALKLG